MKITDILSEGKRTVSFEVFPPKTDTVFDSVKTATEEIAKLSPAFMSVTYGAGGGTSRYTLEIAKNIKEKYGVPTMAHLTCVSSTKQSVREKIGQIKEAGIENIMALRGDIPQELEGSDRSKWDYRYATDLIKEIRSISDDFCIGGACYPEIHPESPSRAEDIKHLKEKVDCGVSFLTTQMFFDNALFYDFVSEIRKQGITVPIIPGIMPITNAVQIERAVKLSGSFIPEHLKDLAKKYGTSPEEMKAAGIDFATKQIEDLFANGIKNIHVYTMNNPGVADKIKSNLSGILD